MIFDNLPDVSDEELEEIVVQRFRELRTAIYSILPRECLLRSKRVLIDLITFLDIGMISKRLIVKEDICSLCSLSECPHNHMADRKERIEKIMLIGKPAKRLQ